jgi:hypothetical protein
LQRCQHGGDAHCRETGDEIGLPSFEALGDLLALLAASTTSRLVFTTSFARARSVAASTIRVRVAVASTVRAG